MTLKSDIRQSIKKFIREEEFSVYGWLPYFIDTKLNANKLMHFPEVGEWDHERECESTTSFEPLDFENCEILSVSENELIFCAGGDWQQPMTVSLSFDPVTEVYNCQVLSRDYNEGMSNEAFLQEIDVSYTHTGRVVFPDNYEPVESKSYTQQPVTTKYCKQYILEYFRNRRTPMLSPLCDEKNWKRVSKRGSGIVYREFLNTVMGTRILIESTKTSILSLTEL